MLPFRQYPAHLLDFRAPSPYTVYVIKQQDRGGFAMSTALAAARDGFLRLTRPQSVRTNQDTGLIRLIALITMAIDHFGKMCFPHLFIMREIGRLAFPLFAYGIAVGAVYTKNPFKYLERVVLLALISQPLYAIGLAHESPLMYAVPFFENPLGAIWNFYYYSWTQQPSILFALSLGLAILLCLRERRWVLAVAFYILCECIRGKLDYGINGIRLMMIFYLLCEHPVACLAASISFMTWWAGRGAGYTFFGHSFDVRILSMPSIVLCCIPMPRRLRLPRWLIYGFYPAHCAVLAVLVKCVL